MVPFHSTIPPMCVVLEKAICLEEGSFYGVCLDNISVL